MKESTNKINQLFNVFSHIYYSLGKLTRGENAKKQYYESNLMVSRRQGAQRLHKKVWKKTPKRAYRWWDLLTLCDVEVCNKNIFCSEAQKISVSGSLISK